GHPCATDGRSERRLCALLSFSGRQGAGPRRGRSSGWASGRASGRGRHIRNFREKHMSDMGLVVVGAGGRMGLALVRAVHETQGARVVAAVERKGSPAIGKDIGELAGLGPLGVIVSDDPLAAFAKADGVLDFTAPAASVEFAGYAAQ